MERNGKLLNHIELLNQTIKLYFIAYEKNTHFMSMFLEWI